MKDYQKEAEERIDRHLKGDYDIQTKESTMDTSWIKTVKQKGDDFLVNNEVMAGAGGKDSDTYKSVILWLKTNSAEKEYTREEQTKIERIKAKTSFVYEIEKLIQSEVERLNEAKGVDYKDKYSCKAYGDTQGYLYQAECKALWDWSVIDLYEPMRRWEQTLTSIPSEEEFLTELNKHKFVTSY